MRTRRIKLSELKRMIREEVKKTSDRNIKTIWLDISAYEDDPRPGYKGKSFSIDELIEKTKKWASKFDVKAKYTGREGQHQTFDFTGTRDDLYRLCLDYAGGDEDDALFYLEDGQ